ncbi:MAG: T9SS type A sorting domain-containing protein [Candidatus Zixiibacteriota bacterium]|nr:MAG: T9SS type A sorting domain-containing protein [candidate division Zixibacteria bacterium]
MKRLFIYIFSLLLGAGSVRAELSQTPDNVILINQLRDVFFVGDCAVGLTPSGLASYSYDDNTGTFAFVDWLYFEGGVVSMKRYGYVVVVCVDNQDLHFVNVATLPQLTYLGMVQLDEPFADFALSGNDLYTAHWFDGVWRYQLQGYVGAQFADSSMLGVYVTQLEVIGDSLYALDEYNGLLQYDVCGDGFGDFLDYLYIPRRAGGFTVCDSLFCMLLESGDMYFGQFHPDGAEIIDSLTEVGLVGGAYGTDDLLIVVVDNFIIALNREDLTVDQTVPRRQHYPDGDIIEFDGRPFLGLPAGAGGLTLFDIEDGFSYRECLFRSGNITDLLIRDDLLLTTGLLRPLDAYRIHDTIQATYDYTMFQSYLGTSLVRDRGDTLLAVSAALSSVLLIDNFTDADSFSIVNGFHANVGDIADLVYINDTTRDREFIITVGEYDIEARSVSDSGKIQYESTWSFYGEPIRAAAVEDNILYVETGKSARVASYRINIDYSLSYLDGVALTSEASMCLIRGDYLYAFQHYNVHVIDITDPTDLRVDDIVELPYPVSDAGARGDILCTVSASGIGVFRVVEDSLKLVGTSPFGGEELAVGDGVLAVTNGNGVCFFALDCDEPTDVDEPSLAPSTFRLNQNYPNPFNLATTISFELPRRGRVNLTVYNILGQRVAVLVDETMPAGSHSVAWDGRNESGHTAASGVYFYRLLAGDHTDSRKMVLVK